MASICAGRLLWIFRIPAPVAVGDVRVVSMGQLEVMGGPSDCEAGLKVSPDEPG